MTTQALPVLLDEIAPGVLGYTVEHDGAIYVPYLQAEQEGSGAVGRYLDSLPSDKRIVIPTDGLPGGGGAGAAGVAMKLPRVRAPGAAGKIHVLPTEDSRQTLCGCNVYPPDWQRVYPLVASGLPPPRNEECLNCAKCSTGVRWLERDVL